MSTLARTSDRIGLGRPVADMRAAGATVAPLAGRGAAAAALAGLVIVPLGVSDGGYFGRSLTSVTVALAAAAGLALLRAPVAKPSRALTVTVLGLGLLSAWIALSSRWAAEGATVELETRRALLYVVGLVAIVVVVGERHRRAFLLSLTACLTTLAVVGLGMRLVSGVPVDPFYGSLLAEPVGYPNAMGVLAATGIVLSIGLGGRGRTSPERLLRGVAPLLVVVLGLTGSRGAALALGIGLAVLLLLSERGARWHLVGVTASALLIGGGCWALVTKAGEEGLPLVIAAACAATIGAATPTLGRRAACGLLFVLIATVGVAATLHPPETTSSLRTAYWGAAFAELRERPFFGSGAGSFHLTWQEHRNVDADVRDAHSLYVETLSELGPFGLVLVLVIVAVPLGAAVRGRGDPLVAAAGAGLAVFAVHAGLDWDWEVPVVTLVAIGCAGTALAATPARRQARADEGGSHDQ